MAKNSSQTDIPQNPHHDAMYMPSGMAGAPMLSTGSVTPMAVPLVGALPGASSATQSLSMLMSQAVATNTKMLQGGGVHMMPAMLSAGMPTLGGVAGTALGPGMGTSVDGAVAYGSTIEANAAQAAQPVPTREVKTKRHLRQAAGQVWNDETLEDWPDTDFRVFCGDLGNEVTDELLANAFRRYESFQKSRVVRDKKTGKSKGYGFVSFSDPHDMLKALKEMDRKYVGNRPIRVMKSRWKDREITSEKNRKNADQLQTVPLNSKSLKKFKSIKPVTGGKRATNYMAPPSASATAGRARQFGAYHGPRPPPFGNMGTQRIMRPGP